MNGFRSLTLLSFSLTVTSIAVTSIAVTSSAAAQATPSAIQNLQLSAFGGLTGAYTGLESSKNLSLTAGADVGFRPLFGVYPSIEVRGTYPMDSGTVAGERNILFGVKVEKPYRRVLHPYGTFFYGRNEIKYQGGGYPNATGTLLYIDSIANMFSLGGGVDIDLTPHFAAKFDGQFQRYETPVTASGAVYAKAFTIGVVYRIDFNHHFHYDRRTGQVTNPRKEPLPPAPKPVPPPPPDAATPDQPAPADAAPPAPADTAAPAPTPAPDPNAAPPAPSPDSAAPAPAPAQTTPAPTSTNPQPQ